jgi:hypothetical protein
LIKLRIRTQNERAARARKDPRLVKQLHVSETVAFPLELMTLATAVLANRGAGKTYFASVLTEELLSAGQQVIILDPVGVLWGLKSGYSIAVFGGDHADVPLQPHSGQALAKAVVEHGFSAIFDMSEMDNQEALGFAAAFLSELYRKNKQSCYVVIDEADIFAPQSSTKGNGPNALRAMQFLVRRGRARGLGCALITQRPQAIAKDVLTQCEVLVALRVSHPRDIDAIKEWVNTQASAAESKEVVQSLPSLPTGEAWFWAPSLKLFQRAKVRMRQTFDSSATPKPGQARMQPKHLEAVDLQKLGAQIAATVEEQKANDPAALKARIRELERARIEVVTDKSGETELREQLKAAQAESIDLRARMQAYAQKVCIETEQELRTLEGLARNLTEGLAAAQIRAKERIDGAPKDADVKKPPSSFRAAAGARNQSCERVIYDAPRLPAHRVVEGAPEVNGPKQQILNAIATFKHANVPARPAYIAGFCGTTVRARGFEENIRQLRKDGMVTTLNGVFDSNGYGHPSDLGSGWAALRAVLSDPQCKMLQAVRDTPRVTAESLAEFMGTTVRARGFEENLRRLRADELLTGGKDALTVAEWLR